MVESLTLEFGPLSQMTLEFMYTSKGTLEQAKQATT